jgi:hypothetical protein
MTVRPAIASFAIPIITCPRCSHHMRLSTIMPDRDERERMTFTCQCGFDYQQSAAVLAERTL